MGLWLITRGFILPFVRALNEFFFFLPLFVKGEGLMYRFVVNNKRVYTSFC